jgi:hypothetical protein
LLSKLPASCFLLVSYITPYSTPIQYTLCLYIVGCIGLGLYGYIYPFTHSLLLSDFLIHSMSHPPSGRGRSTKHLLSKCLALLTARTHDVTRVVRRCLQTRWVGATACDQCRQCSRTIHCITCSDLLPPLFALGSHPQGAVGNWATSKFHASDRCLVRLRQMELAEN